MTFDKNDIYFMEKAIALAKRAASLNEVPVGAVIVRNGVIVARGMNRRETKKNALLHAETAAIYKACNKLGGWRLHECELYVTLEPCAMCAGAIVNSRIKRVIFGAFDKKAGAMGSVFNINTLPLNHKPEITSGVLEEECSSLLSDFFISLRRK